MSDTEAVPETDTIEMVAVAAPKFVGKSRSGKERSRVVKLDWPVEYEGKIYDEIVVRRLTVQDLADWSAALEDDPGAPAPMFDAPQAVLLALDADDDAALGVAAQDFLPRKLREAFALNQETGADTSPSSPES